MLLNVLFGLAHLNAFPKNFVLCFDNCMTSTFNVENVYSRTITEAFVLLSSVCKFTALDKAD